MGHAKYRHIPFYFLFFVGFWLAFYYWFTVSTELLYHNLVYDQRVQAMGVSLLISLLPFLALLLIYVRFVMGFFMRQFERQADLYSAVTMGTPKYTIDSLEKIALLTGKSRNLPSWHHFSIRERVNYLLGFFKDPGLARKHNRYVFICFALYVICMAAVGYGLNFSPIRPLIEYKLVGRALDKQALKEPDNPALYASLAMIRHELGDHQGAINAYERVITLDPTRAEAFNNLAWLLVTTGVKTLRDESRGLQLAKVAVSLERSPIFLDTLAEAYYVNGMIDEAIEAIEEAIELARNREGGYMKYYRKQLNKFRESAGSG
jgi:tetratricopeptide (TPR) repeat protein